MNLKKFGLVELNAQETKSIDGGMIHPEGYSNGIMKDSSSQGSFWYGFFAGLFGY